MAEPEVHVTVVENPIANDEPPAKAVNEALQAAGAVVAMAGALADQAKPDGESETVRLLGALLDATNRNTDTLRELIGRTEAVQQATELAVVAQIADIKADETNTETEVDAIGDVVKEEIAAVETAIEAAPIARKRKFI